MSEKNLPAARLIVGSVAGPTDYERRALFYRRYYGTMDRVP